LACLLNKSIHAYRVETAMEKRPHKTATVQFLLRYARNTYNINRRE
jgi:hypothetical protein